MRNFLDKISSALRKFMYGRYGSDQLNLCLMVVCLVLWLLSALIQVAAVQTVLGILSYAAILYAIYRMMSRNYDRRRKENDWFLEKTGPITRAFKRMRRQMGDKDYKYFKCPSCGQTLRVPKGKGKIHVTCRNCGASFQQKT
ncbi:MAG: hypothetical protein LIO78_11130 [Clostridiales bacterium]|nr:hypothetical protein [Clostridiales bacterium]